jgi:hypothetical protein
LTYFRTASGNSFGNRHTSQRRHHFGEHRTIERDPCDSERRRHRRMRVHHRLNLGALPVDLEVHLHFG